MMRVQPGTLPLQARTEEQQNVAGLVEVWHDEQATLAPGSGGGTADADSSSHRFSVMSPRELSEHLKVLRAEDIDLDDALGTVDLRHTNRPSVIYFFRPIYITKFSGPKINSRVLLVPFCIIY